MTDGSGERLHHTGEADIQQFMAEIAQSRREFIQRSLGGLAAGTVLAAGACAPREEAGEESAADQAADQAAGEAAEEATEGLTAADLEGAEKVMQVSFTPEIRKEIIEYLPRVSEPITEIRKFEFDNGLPPAPNFDPRLPGETYPEQANAVTIAEAAPALPASAEDIAFAPVIHLSEWIRTRQLTSSQLTEIYLDRIEKYAGRLECFVTVTADLARQQAARADAEIAAGNYRGRLHGIPYSLKDLADTKGIRTTWGATPYKDRIATRDATVVTRLQNAGAVLLGKATSGALAFGDVWFGGMTRNPWNPEEGSSGSSAGPSSSTAAGLAAFGIGTETLGSIISPATRCGLAGLRPSFGRVSRAGFMALAWSLDKVGPLCRSVEDTAVVLAAINGLDFEDASSVAMGFAYDGDAPLDGIRIGYMPAAYEEENINDTDRAALEAAKGLGVELKEIELPELPYGSLFPIIRAESAAAFEQLVQSGEVDSLKFVGNTARGVSWRAVRFLSAVDYVNFERLRRLVMQAMNGVFEDVDVIVGPSYAQSMLTITNYTGHPQLAFRAGFYETPTRDIFGNVADEEGPKFRVPRSSSVFARLYGDGLAVRVARALEQALGVRNERPTLTE